MENPAKTRYEFPPFRLDPAKQVLLREGERIPLTQKAFATLLVLLEQHGRTVEKEELISRVWEGATVEENNLNQCISSVRKALGEKRDEHRFIVTVPGKGYCFVAEVRETPLAQPVEIQAEPVGVHQPRQSKGSNRRAKTLGLIATAVGLILLAIAVLGISRVRSSGRQKHGPVAASVAVLPFLNLGGNSENDYFSDGLTEELTTALSEAQGIRVVARTSAFQFRGKSEDVRQVGEQLGVGAVIEGSVTRSGDGLRVTAQLVSTKDGYHLWSRTFDVPQSQGYAIQQEIVRETVRVLGFPPPVLAHKYTVNPEAHDLYLEGRYYWNKRDLPDMERAAQLFQAAIQKDPNFALAYAGLADSYVVMGGNGQKPLSEVVPHAKPALAKALELDPELAEVHATMALLNSEMSGERRDLIPELRRAVELSPGYASAHHWLGLILSSERRFEEADAELRKAQVLDPLSPMITEGVAENFYYWRRYDEAIAEALRVRKLGSGVGDGILGLAYVQKARYQDAIVVFERLAQTDHAPPRLIQLAIAYAAAGQKSRARTLLRKATTATEGYVPPYWVGLVYLYLGEKNTAFGWLQKANQQKDPSIGNLKVDPMLDPIRSDPRYLDLLKKADLSN
jgi:TolB-like protein/DNA-binding winged helix-turn-helix (wHTH) protein/Tfp pilus assembly protein PilF